MVRRALLCFAILAAALPGAREPHWIRLRSANFEIYSSAGERSTRDILTYFEQVRGFFMQTLARRMTTEPVFIVAFGSKKEYEPYRLNEFATAYYRSTADRDYIVLSDVGSGIFPVAVHEYAHLVIRHLNLNLPPWLNEGLAELYSTLKPQGDRLLVGSLIDGRYQALLREEWVPLDTILKVDHESPYYNEKAKAGNFYNESWALTHMLLMSDAYSAKADKLILSVHDGVPSAEALFRIYGKTVGEVEQDLQNYLRGAYFHGTLYNAKLQKADASIPAEVAAPTDVRLVLAQLMNRPGKEAEARKEFQALVASDPKRPEPYAELGYLAWHGGWNDEAREFFRKAFDRGDRNPRMLWDYGHLAGTDTKEATRVLSALVEQQPDRIDARLALAQAHLMGRDAVAALAALAPIHDVGRSYAGQLFRTIAYAQVQIGNIAEARNAALRWQNESRDEIDKSRASRFLADLDRRQTSPIPAAGSPIERQRDDGPPKLRRRDGPPPPPPPSFEGAFVQLQCKPDQTWMVVEEAGGRKTFLIEDPVQIRVLTKSGRPREFACGPQEPGLKVRVQYEPPAQGANSGDGIVRAIEIR